MVALAQGQASDCDNPELDIFIQVNGVLTDVYSLEFIIKENVTTPGTPNQVYPPAGRETVDVSNLCPTGDKLSTGRYVAQYTPELTEPVGSHFICWYFKLTAASPEQAFTEEFEVLPEATATGASGYCTVGCLRDEGVPSSFTDTYLLERISLASSTIDRITGRFFEPRALELDLDGRGGRKLLLDIPIIGISSMEFETSPFQPSSLTIDPDLLKVYNRHLTQNLTQPDDRNSPKIELFHASDDITNASPYVFTRLIYPLGQQNIHVVGTFGFTDYSSANTQGVTPPLIKRLCCLLVIRDLYPMFGSCAKRHDALNRYRIQSERTRDQSYSLESLAGAKRFGVFTGDPEIDWILASYMRPPKLGAA
jgi:hypothetical protein